MRCMIKYPGDIRPKEVNIDNSLEALQKAVGGYIEHFGFSAGVGLLFDEDGRYKGPVVNGKPTSLESNFALNDMCVDFVGPVLFVGESGDEFIDLTEEQILEINQFFELQDDRNA